MKSKDPKPKESKSKEMKGGKCRASSSGRKSTKRGKASDGDVAQALAANDIVDDGKDIEESDSKPDTASESKSERTFSFRSAQS